MRCPVPETWIAFYGGELEEPLAGRLAEHLRECPRCRGKFDRLCRLGAGLRDAFQNLPPAAARRPRLARLPSSDRPPWLPLAAAALLAAAAAAAILAPRGTRPPGGPPVARETPAVPEEPVPPQAPPQPEAAPPPPAPAERAPQPAPTPPSEPPAAEPDRVPAPPPPPPPPRESPEPEPARDRAGETSAALAVLEGVEGEAWIAAPSGRDRARTGRGLRPSEGLVTTGPDARASLKFPDGTRVELAGRSAIDRILDRGGAEGTGKWLELSRGTLSVRAARQPAGRAMAISTPHAEARVVGTEFRIRVEPGERGCTRLEVVEGRVRLARLREGPVDVPGGHFAVAAGGGNLVAGSLPALGIRLLHRFDFEDGRLPKPFRAGAVDRGPPRPGGGRFCLAGALDPNASCGGRVSLTDDARGLFPFSEDLVAGFDYWVDDRVRTLDVQVWNRTQQTTFGTTLWNPPREEWARAVLPLAEFARPGRNGPLRMKPGDLIVTFWVQAGQVGGALYLDNLEIARLRPGAGKGR